MRESLGEEDLGSVSWVLPALGRGSLHQGLIFIIQWPMGDLGAHGSFIFSWIMERVMWEEGREKVGLSLLRL